jgi:lysophospholipase L1-like esterase
VTSLAPGTSTTFTVQALSGMPIVHNANISIVNNGAETPKLIAVTVDARQGLNLDINPAFGTYQDTGATTPATADSAPVRLIQDQSGSNNHASAASDAARPILKLNQRNGKPAVRYDGVDDVLNTVSFLGTAHNKALSYFIVAKGQPTDTKIIISNQGQRLYYGRDNFEQIFAHQQLSGTNGKDGYSKTSGSDIWISGSSYDGTAWRTMSNGNYKSRPFATNLNLSGALTIGDFSTGGFKFAWDVFRIFVWNAGLSLAQMQAVAAALAEEYVTPLCTRRIVCEGDSLTVGFGSTAGNDYPSQLMNLLAGDGDYLWNRAANGDTLANMSGAAATQVDTVSGTNVQPRIVVWAGTNDLKNSLKTGAALATDYLNYCAARRAAGAKVVAVTILPRSDGTPVGFEAERQTFNTAIRAGSANYDALADIAADSRIGDAGDELNTTYYVDLCHMTNAGYAIVADLVRDAIESIP